MKRPRYGCDGEEGRGRYPVERGGMVATRMGWN